jgi:polyisoprenoid-binding protein YceI
MTTQPAQRGPAQSGTAQSGTPQSGTAQSGTPQLGRYTIDPERSRVGFATRHLFGLPVRGSFAIRSGTVDVTEPAARSSVRVEIDAASFDTGNQTRDKNVRSGRFLDADRYPTMRFTADRLDDSTLAGMLTVRGVSRPVTVTLEEVTRQDGTRQEAPTADHASFAARATTRIDRTDFGVTASRGLAGRYLTVTLDIRCVGQ